MNRPGDSAEARAKYLDDLASGYRNTQILLTAVRLGLFLAVEERGAATARELASDLDADPRGVRILGDALVALELLEKEDESYRNGDLAGELLLPESPGSQVPLLIQTAELYERCAGLYDSVKSGAPVPKEKVDTRLRHSPESFARAMDVVGR